MMSALRKFLDSPTFNFCGAVLSAGAEIVGWLANVSPAYVQPGAFVLTVFFLGRLAWTQYWEAQRYREQEKPKFDIVFSPTNEDPDSRPYFQVLRYGAFQSGPGYPMTEMGERRYRIGIVNLSSAVIPAVRVILAACVPGGNFIHVGHRLLVMDSDPPAGERDLPPSPNWEPTLWFDVVNENGRASDVPKYFMFCYANPNLVGPVEHDLRQGEEYWYDIVLRAEGGGYSCQRSFRVAKGWDNRRRRPLQMEPL